MIHSHARCDRCEKNLIPLGEEGVTEDYVLDAGWIVVHWVEEGEEESIDQSRDFCSMACASRWMDERVKGEADVRADQR